MKKIFYFILTFVFLFSIVGCSRQEASETDMALDDIMTAITESQTELPSLDQVRSGEEEFSTWLSDYYFIQPEQVEDGIICYADGVEASEIAVLLLEDEKDGNTVEELLEQYIQNRAGIFEGYAPQQAALAKDGIVVVNGRYIALLICGEPSAAKTAFLECFGGDMKSAGNSEGNKIRESSKEGEYSKNSVEEDTYDAEAILQAWKSGDDSSLSEMNRSILNAAKDVIEQEIDESMSEYEKELAIHDWITGWSSFDYGVFDRSSGEGFEAGSDTPYGVLIDRSAMCHGYSSTFQLFMDMLDIECITVFGTPGSNGVEHSWNMVNLDGEWYCVDAAWDDPIGGSPGHTYFNVTSETLRKGSIHRWDDTSVPEATGTKYAYNSQ